MHDKCFFKIRKGALRALRCVQSDQKKEGLQDGLIVMILPFFDTAFAQPADQKDTFAETPEVQQLRLMHTLFFGSENPA